MRSDIQEQEVFLALVLDDALVQAEFEAMMAAAFPPVPPAEPPAGPRHPAVPASSVDVDGAPCCPGRRRLLRKPGAGQERSPPALIALCP